MHHIGVSKDPTPLSFLQGRPGQDLNFKLGMIVLETTIGAPGMLTCAFQCH